MEENTLNKSLATCSVGRGFLRITRTSMLSSLSVYFEKHQPRKN